MHQLDLRIQGEQQQKPRRLLTPFLGEELVAHQACTNSTWGVQAIASSPSHPDHRRLRVVRSYQTTLRMIRTGGIAVTPKKPSPRTKVVLRNTVLGFVRDAQLSLRLPVSRLTKKEQQSKRRVQNIALEGVNWSFVKHKKKRTRSHQKRARKEREKCEIENSQQKKSAKNAIFHHSQKKGCDGHFFFWRHVRLS